MSDSVDIFDVLPECFFLYDAGERAERSASALKLNFSREGRGRN